MDDSSQTGLGEDNEDDIEYVVERLDEDEIEDEKMEFVDVKENIELVNTEQEEEKEMDNNQSNEESVIKKIKILPEVIYITNYAIEINNLI